MPFIDRSTNQSLWQVALANCKGVTDTRAIDVLFHLAGLFHNTFTGSKQPTNHEAFNEKFRVSRKEIAKISEQYHFLHRAIQADKPSYLKSLVKFKYILDFQSKDSQGQTLFQLILANPSSSRGKFLFCLRAQMDFQKIFQANDETFEQKFGVSLKAIQVLDAVYKNSMQIALYLKY